MSKAYNVNNYNYGYYVSGLCIYILALFKECQKRGWFAQSKHIYWSVLKCLFILLFSYSIYFLLSYTILFFNLYVIIFSHNISITLKQFCAFVIHLFQIFVLKYYITFILVILFSKFYY